MKRIGTSERYQNKNLKAIINYSKFFGGISKLNDSIQQYLFVSSP